MREQGVTERYCAISVCVDVVLFTIADDGLQLLLVQRRNMPYRGQWALPGGFMEPDEELRDAAIRELREKTGVDCIYLEQLYTFGTLGRDPRGRVVSVTYFALAPMRTDLLVAGSDAMQARWFKVGDYPQLAFDHEAIIDLAKQRLSAKLEYSTIAFQFMDRHFTLGRLQKVYEIISGQDIDKRNFRRRICALPCVHDTGRTTCSSGVRPARLYTIEKPSQVEFIR
ncbi:MAG: NUDIX hydrolase [Candidatus Porifericomitaceae bacterium WSBS_2022_MAG_OTU9]